MKLLRKCDGILESNLGPGIGNINIIVSDHMERLRETPNSYEISSIMERLKDATDTATLNK